MLWSLVGRTNKKFTLWVEFSYFLKFTLIFFVNCQNFLVFIFHWMFKVIGSTHDHYISVASTLADQSLSPGVAAPTLPLPSPNLMRPKFESPTAYVELRNDQ